MILGIAPRDYPGWLVAEQYGYPIFVGPRAAKIVRDLGEMAWVDRDAACAAVADDAFSIAAAVMEAL